MDEDNSGGPENADDVKDQTHHMNNETMETDEVAKYENGDEEDKDNDNVKSEESKEANDNEMDVDAPDDGDEDGADKDKTNNGSWVKQVSDSITKTLEEKEEEGGDEDEGDGDDGDGDDDDTPAAAAKKRKRKSSSDGKPAQWKNQYESEHKKRKSIEKELLDAKKQLKTAQQELERNKKKTEKQQQKFEKEINATKQKAKEAKDAAKKQKKHGGASSKNSKSRRTPNPAHTWDDYLHKLLLFRAQHGHCLVPSFYRDELDQQEEEEISNTNPGNNNLGVDGTSAAVDGGGDATAAATTGDGSINVGDATATATAAGNGANVVGDLSAAIVPGDANNATKIGDGDAKTGGNENGNGDAKGNDGKGTEKDQVVSGSALGKWVRRLRIMGRKQQHHQQQELEQQQEALTNDAGNNEITNGNDDTADASDNKNGVDDDKNAVKTEDNDAMDGDNTEEANKKKKRRRRSKIPKTIPDEIKITPERLAILDSIGFRWSIFEEKEQSLKNWDDMYEKLIEFKEAYGHCNVSQNNTGRLGGWVKTQRERYQRTQKWILFISENGSDYTYNPKNTNYIAYLSDSQIDRLNNIGFVWQLVSKESLLGWDGQYEDLIDYKSINGHCNVPQSFKGKQNLGRWVSKQRELYWDKLRPAEQRKFGNRCNALTDERIYRLNNVGFLWRGAKAAASSATSTSANPPSQVAAVAAAATGTDTRPVEPEAPMAPVAVVAQGTVAALAAAGYSLGDDVNLEQAGTATV